MADKKKFAFLVLAYNHEDYIIEHLESIKFQIEKYGISIDSDIIINDDSSIDQTRALVDRWLLDNNAIFRNIVKIYNKENLGTCSSLVNMLDAMSPDLDGMKITAGDDVYSYEDIFAAALYEPYREYSFISGMPLNLMNSKLSIDTVTFWGMVASEEIYRNRSALERFTLLNVTNAPNLIYKIDRLSDQRVIDFLKGFDVVEDWPLQIAISKYYEKSKFKLVNKVYVYYRRTPGSTYLVANKRFEKDKSKLYQYLIDTSDSVVKKFLLSNRKRLFLLNNRYANKLLNVSFYLFVVRAIFKFKPILKWSKMTISTDLDKHKLHYSLIRSRAESFLK